MKSAAFFLFMALAISSSSWAGGKSRGAYIGFHPEGDEAEGPKFVRPDVVGGEQHFFRINPDLTIRHVDSFYAFLSEDGATFGAILKLNAEGQRAHDVMVSTNLGKLTRTIVNGRAIDVLRVDRPRQNDGQIVIWKGLTLQDLELMEKKLKRLDPLGKEAQKKKKKRGE
jgi:hypothetical protein